MCSLPILPEVGSRCRPGRIKGVPCYKVLELFAGMAEMPIAFMPAMNSSNPYFQKQRNLEDQLFPRRGETSADTVTVEVRGEVF